MPINRNATRARGGAAEYHLSWAASVCSGDSESANKNQAATTTVRWRGAAIRASDQFRLRLVHTANQPVFADLQLAKPYPKTKTHWEAVPGKQGKTRSYHFPPSQLFSDDYRKTIAERLDLISKFATEQKRQGKWVSAQSLIDKVIASRSDHLQQFDDYAKDEHSKFLRDKRRTAERIANEELTFRELTAAILRGEFGQGMLLLHPCGDGEEPSPITRDQFVELFDIFKCEPEAVFGYVAFMWLRAGPARDWCERHHLEFGEKRGRPAGSGLDLSKAVRWMAAHIGAPGVLERRTCHGAAVLAARNFFSDHKNQTSMQKMLRTAYRKQYG